MKIVRLKQEIGHQSERDDNANERIFTVGQHASIDCEIIFGMLVEFICVHNGNVPVLILHISYITVLLCLQPHHKSSLIEQYLAMLTKQANSVLSLTFKSRYGVFIRQISACPMRGKSERSCQRQSTPPGVNDTVIRSE